MFFVRKESISGRSSRNTLGTPLVTLLSLQGAHTHSPAHSHALTARASEPHDQQPGPNKSKVSEFIMICTSILYHGWYKMCTMFVVPSNFFWARGASFAMATAEDIEEWEREWRKSRQSRDFFGVCVTALPQRLPLLFCVPCVRGIDE